MSEVKSDVKVDASAEAAKAEAAKAEAAKAEAAKAEAAKAEVEAAKEEAAKAKAEAEAAKAEAAKAKAEVEAAREKTEKVYSVAEALRTADAEPKKPSLVKEGQLVQPVYTDSMTDSITKVTYEKGKWVDAVPSTFLDGQFRAGKIQVK